MGLSKIKEMSTILLVAKKTKTCKKENREICWHMVTPKATCVFLMMLRKTLNQVSSYKVVS